MRKYLSVLVLALAMQPFSSVWADTNTAVKDAKNSVVKILAKVLVEEKGKRKVEQFSGSGFVVGDGKHVVTNRHVIKDAFEIYVLDGGNGEINKQNATVLKDWESRDLALLEVKTLKDRTPLKLYEGSPIEETQGAWAVGFPGLTNYLDQTTHSVEKSSISEVSPTVTDGKVSRVSDTAAMGNKAADIKVIQHTATINGGNSGGPLLNNCGAVIGVNNIVLGKGVQLGSLELAVFGVTPMFNAVHVSELAEFLKGASQKVETSNKQCDASGKEEDAAATTTTASEGNPNTSSLFSKIPWQTASAFGLIALALTGLSLLFLRKRQPPAGTSSALQLSPMLVNPGVSPIRASAADVDPDAPAYFLQGLDGYEHLRFPLERDGSIHLGRSESQNDYAIADDSVSRRHVSLRRDGGRWLVEDENSLNGTYLNGHQLVPHRSHHLSVNDILKLGEVKFVLNHW